MSSLKCEALLRLCSFGPFFVLIIIALIVAATIWLAWAERSEPVGIRATQVIKNPSPKLSFLRSHTQQPLQVSTQSLLYAGLKSTQNTHRATNWRSNAMLA
eukprot:2337626-Amphidinium_carterae.2